MLGKGCHILLENRTGREDAPYQRNGNVFLNEPHGASIECHPGGTDMEATQVVAAARGGRVTPSAH